MMILAITCAFKIQINFEFPGDIWNYDNGETHSNPGIRIIDNNFFFSFCLISNKLIILMIDDVDNNELTDN